MFNSCCPDLLVNVSTEYPELVAYQGLYHPLENETTGRGGKKSSIALMYRYILRGILPYYL